MQEQLHDRYFNWISSLIDYPELKDPIMFYNDVLIHLLNTEFTWTIALDENRADDGIELRYRFGFENGIGDAIIHNQLDTRPCSVLEMMVALALRCEDDLMQGTEERHVERWFWIMMDNLGLGEDTYEFYDPVKTDNVVNTFLNRQYSPDGSFGGIFIIPNCVHDLRTVDIWYQMMWYLTAMSKTN